MIRFVCISLLLLLLSLCGFAATERSGWEHPPAQQRNGVFWREHWYERGASNSNPGYERRLRVNPPEIMLHPTFGRRIEARENGLMLIRTEEDLFQIAAAELYLEMWGGHPGTANKRASINGRGTYSLPRVGTEEGHCTYSYPVVPLPITDLVNGWNAVQLGLDQGSTFWGHMMVDEGCLRVALSNRHPDLLKIGLADFSARVIPELHGEVFSLSLGDVEAFAPRIERVDFQAWHWGYDENGNQQDTDWHGFTQNRAFVSGAASATMAPFKAEWNVSMLPSKKNVAVRALIRFKQQPDLVYVTAATAGLSIPERKDRTVALYYARDLPVSFWSRAGTKKMCSIIVDVEAAQIDNAELLVRAWTGGSGNVRDYFTLNGKPFPVAEGAKHVPQFSRLPISPALLKRGTNQVELHSDTEHHGIEILYPGPALMVRYKR